MFFRCICLLWVIAGSAVQAAQTWDMAVAYPPGNYQTKAAERFAAAVSSATSGAVNIKVQAGGALGFKGPEMLGVIRQGLVPIGTMLLNQQAGVEPLLAIGSLPFLVSSEKEMRAITDLARPEYERIAKKHNQKILYIVPWPGQNVFTKAELMNSSHFRNQKIRTVDRTGADYFRSLGASPSQMPWGEVVPALATGVINAVTTSSSSAVDGQFWDFLNLAYQINWQSNFDMVTVNLDSWAKLSPQEQRQIEDIGKQLESTFWQMASEEDSQKMKLLTEKGVKVSQPSAELREFMKSKSAPAWDEFSKRVPDARPILDKYRTSVGK